MGGFRRLTLAHFALAAILLACPILTACNDAGTEETESKDQLENGKSDSPTEVFEIRDVGYMMMSVEDGYSSGRSYKEIGGDLFEGRSVNLSYYQARAMARLADAGCNLPIDKYYYISDETLRDKYSIVITLFAEFRTNGNLVDTQSFTVVNNSITKSVFIPEGTDQLITYAYIETKPVNDEVEPLNESCSLWDSAFGANYKFNVKSAPAITGTMVLDNSWNEFIDGKLSAGKSMRISYDHNRLTDMLNRSWSSKYGFSIPPSLYANIRIDNGPFFTVHVGTYHMANSYDRSNATWADNAPVIYLPSSARYVEVYFEVKGYGGTTGYDSNYGSNYHFDVN